MGSIWEASIKETRARASATWFSAAGKHHDQVDALRLVGQVLDLMTAGRAPTEKIRFGNEMTMDEALQLAKPKRPGSEARIESHPRAAIRRRSVRLRPALGKLKSTPAYLEHGNRITEHDEL